MMKNENFRKLLVSKGFLTEEDCRQLLVKFKDDDYSILRYLAHGTAAKKKELGVLWGDSLGLPYEDITKVRIQHNVVQKLPESFAREHMLIPLYQFGESITVATADPANPLILEEATRILKIPASPVFAFPEDIEDAIEIQYKTHSALSSVIGKIASKDLFKSTTRITSQQLKELAGDKSIIEFTRSLILLAFKERASDIHIEPEEDKVRIRFRVDGVLHERLTLEPSLLPPLEIRLKVLANVDITEKRRPQDGRISIALPNKSIDIRFSSVPTIYGEKIVLRILGQIDFKEVPSLEAMDLSKTIYDDLSKIIDHPNGVFFVTGPTGSGKTTTLYAALNHINKPGVNIMTVEDPVEIRLAGTTQVQVNEEIGFDFADALRSFLRQDPDVILVGEIRDMETAKTASQAALTGHLVLTTIHTNSALQAVTRLIEIGVEPFLVAPSIIGVMAQRLVRRLCDNCKERYQPSPDEIAKLVVKGGEQEVFFCRPKGCDQCGNTGYHGRIAIHEIFVINDEMRHLIASNSSSLDIKECARKSGFQPMRYDGIKKVLRGLTSLKEIDRVTFAEGSL